ncbi:MAG: hypothetical protein GXO68_03375 [Crenarchaeota archaeon]|nr:hypothetical protein [Thermoproteota archaeon]
MEGVFLDAKPVRGGLKLAIATEEGITYTRVHAVFKAYLKPSPYYTPEEIANGIHHDEIEAWVEEWLKPPWYNEATRVVVVASENPSLLNHVSRTLEAKGVARRVNEYPGPLVTALWELGVPPGTTVRLTANGIEPLEDPRDPLYEPPPLTIASLEAYSWHGPISAPWERADYYLLECCGLRLKLRDPYEALDILDSMRPHIVVSRLETRHQIDTGRHEWLWFDPTRNLVSPWGIIEWMRISWLPYHEAHGAAIGKVLTAAEAREAYKRRFLLDPGTPRAESFRSLRMLTAADMAGAARIPEPGLYWNIIQLDYSSLYPSLIHIHNISSETVERPTCTSYKTAPGVGHRICLDEPGLVSTVLGRLVERRARIKSSGLRDPRVKERSEAIKWILVSGFGYLGYRNSLFGSITAYECVTAYARMALSIAEEEAEKAGYRVIHSIVDSIFIQPVEPEATVEELMERIRVRVGVPLKLEARYYWLYIPPTRKGPGAVNKYYGSLVDGGVKLKGIMAVRRDTPEFIARLQRAVINILSRARDPHSFTQTLSKTRVIVDAAIEALREGRVPLRLLAIERRVGEGVRRPQAYARRLLEQGLIVDRVKYVVTRRGPQPVWELSGEEEYDVGYYMRMVESMLLELPSPQEIAGVGVRGLEAWPQYIGNT